MKTLKFLCVLAAAVLLAPGGLLAQTTRTWDRGASTDVLLTATNWTGDAVPASTGVTAATRQDASFSGAPGGVLNLTYGAAFGGDYGVGLVMTAAQTSAVNIANSAVGAQTLRIVNSTAATVGGIQIASGAGALTIGAAGAGNPITLALGQGSSALDYYFANNSANTATIEQNVTISRGGNHAASLIFSAGNWNVKGTIGLLSKTSAPTAIGSLNVNAGSVTLSGDNSGHTGATYVNGGTLTFSAANNLGSGTSAVRLGQTSGSGTLEFIGASDATISRLMRVGNGASAGQTGSGTINNNGAGVLTFNNATFNEAGAAVVARTLTLRGTNTGNNTISGTIVDNTGVGATVRVVKEDAGKWVLSGDNTFTGGVDINGGTLAIGHNNALGTGTLKFNDTAARIQSSDATDRTIGNAINFAQSMKFGAASTGNLLFTGAVTGGAAAKTFDVTGTTEFSNTISGAGDRSKNGTGTLVFSGDNSGQAFNLYVNEGTLAFNSANALGAGISAIRVGQTTANAVLKFTGASDATVGRQIRVGNGATAGHTGSSTIQNDSATGAITFDNATFNEASTSVEARSLTLRGSNTGNNLISGAIVDNTGAAVNVVKNDAGTWNLTGENTFTGGLQIWNGVLEFDGNGSLGSQAIQTRIGRTVTSGTLRHTGASDTTVTGQMQVGFGTGGTGNGTIESSGVGALSFNNATFNNAEGAAGVHRTLTLGGNNTGLNTISGAIVNNNNTTAKVALVKAGVGTWTLNGTNTYTGGTTVNGGALNITSSGSLASASTLTVRASGTADFANEGQTLGAVINDNTTANALNFSAATGTVTLASLSGSGKTHFGSNVTITTLTDGSIEIDASKTLTVSDGTTAGAITGGGAFVKTTGGTLTLTGGNTYTGGTTISGGTLLVGSGGSISGGAFAVNNTGTLEIATGGSVATPGDLTIAIGGTLKLAGGSVSANAGANYIAIRGTYDVNGQTVAAGSYEASYFAGANAKLTNSSATAATILGTGDSNTVWIPSTGAIIETVGDLDIQSIVTAGVTNKGFTKTGGGTLTLSHGYNDLGTGIVNISEGAMVLSGNLAAGTVNVSAGTIGIGGSSTLNGSVNYTSSSSSSLSGVIAGTDKTLTMNAPGATLTLGGNNTYSGGTTLSAGTLQISGSGTLGSTSGNLTVSGGVLDFGNTTQTVGSTNITSGTLQNGILNFGSLGIAGNSTVTIGVIGNGSLNISGGTVSLLSAESFTGLTTINGGVVQLSSSLGGGLTMGAGTLNVTNTSFTVGAMNITGGTSTFNGTVNASSVSISGSSNTSFLGSVTSTGAVDITGGTVNTNGNSISGSTVTQSGGSVTGNGSVTATSAFNFTNNGTASSAADYTGSAALNLTGGGSTTLSGSNTYSGATVISNNSTLIAGGSSAISPNSAMTVDGGSALNLAGFGATLQSLAGSGTVTGTGNTVTVNSGTFSGGIAGDLGLTKSTAGTLSITGNQTYTGATSVTGGTLLVNGSLNNGGVTVASGATLGGNVTAGGTTTIQSGGTLAVGNSPGTGNFDALTLEGTTIQEIASASVFDQIIVANTLTYGGALSVVGYGGFTPASLGLGANATQDFNLFFAGTMSGDFASVSVFGNALTDSSGNWSTGSFVGGFKYDFSTSSGILTLTAVPEPSTWIAMAALALTGATMAVRRRRHTTTVL